MAVVEVRAADRHRRAPGLVRRAARPVQGADHVRARRRAAPRPERQGAQAPPPRPGLGRHRPRHLSVHVDEADGTARLIGGYSPGSGRYHFPLAPVCPYTGADDVRGGPAVRRRAALGLDRGHGRTARLRGAGPLRLRHRRARGRGAAGRRPADRARPSPARRGPADAGGGRAAARRPRHRGRFAPDGGGTPMTGVEIVGRRAAPVRPLRGRHRHVDGRHGAPGRPGRRRLEPGRGPGAGGRRVLRARPTAAWPPGTGCSAALALTGMPIVDVEAGCASGGAALSLAASAIRSGEHDAVLVVGIEKMPKGIIRSSFFAPWQEQAGLGRDARLLRAAGAAHDARPRARPRTTSPRWWSRTGRWGEHNPNAMFRTAVTAEQVLASPGRVRAAPPLDAVLAERGCGRGRAAPGRGHPRRAARRRRAAQPPARQRARRVDPDGRADRRRRHHAADDPRGAGRVRGGGHRSGRPRRGRVPGHRRRPRAAHVGGARAVRAGRAALDAGRRRSGRRA